MSGERIVCKNCNGKGKVKVKGKLFKRLCNHCIGGGYFDAYDSVDDFFKSISNKNKTLNKAYGCYIICNHCIHRTYTIKNSSTAWCWKRFKFIEISSGCDDFKCLCKKWKNIENGEE